MTCAQLFVDLLKSENLSFDSRFDSDGDFVVSVPFSGKTVKCIFSGDDGKYLSVYLLFESVPSDNIAQAILLCNTLNTKYKWVTFYVDEDNDLMLHDDAILTPSNAAEEAMEILIRLIKLSRDLKPEIMKEIYA